LHNIKSEKKIHSNKFAQLRAPCLEDGKRGKAPIVVPAQLTERGKIAPEEHVARMRGSGKTREPVQQNGGQLLTGWEYPPVYFVLNKLA
jgi:hypothetical protein